MYDWNGNGKHDAFDDAMFQALLEDDLKRNPPGKKHAYRSASDSSNADIGCFLAAILLLFGIGIVFVFVGGLLQTFENGSIGLLLVLVAILVGLIYFYRKNSIAASGSTDSTRSPEVPTLAHTEQPLQMEKTPVVSSDCIEHIGDYDVSVEKNLVVIKKFTGVDNTVQTVPAVIAECPVHVIDTNAYLNCTQVEKLIIEEGILVIRDGAFRGCDKLREVVIPRSANTIGKDAFPHGQNIMISCYGGSRGLEFARQYKYEYRDAEDMYPSEIKSEQEPKQETKKASEQNDSKKKAEQKEGYSSGSSSSYSRNTASHVSGYAAGLATSMLLLDDSDDDIDWMDGESTRDRLDFDLLGTGYDSYDLEWMDEDEREEILWDNGLDPYDYDLDDLD